MISRQTIRFNVLRNNSKYYKICRQRAHARRTLASCARALVIVQKQIERSYLLLFFFFHINQSPKNRNIRYLLFLFTSSGFRPRFSSSILFSMSVSTSVLPAVLTKVTTEMVWFNARLKDKAATTAIEYNWLLIIITR